MEREARNLTTVIASGAAVSAVIDSTWAAGQGLVTPAALDATTKIAFKVCTSQTGAFLPLYDDSNTLVEVTVTLNAARAYALPEKLFAWPYFKLWAQASGSDVNQSADRSFTISQKS
jgi:hypothetical protein